MIDRLPTWFTTSGEYFKKKHVPLRREKDSVSFLLTNVKNIPTSNSNDNIFDALSIWCLTAIGLFHYCC